MRFLIFLLLAALPSLAMAQNYPSATHKKVTVTGSGSSSPITTTQYGATVNLNGSYTADYIYSCAIQGCGTSVVAADAVRGTAVQPSGSTALTVAGHSSYVLNNNAGISASQSAVGYFGTVIGAVPASQSWGDAIIMVDSMGFTGSTSGAIRYLYGAERDCNLTNTTTKCIGYFAAGNSFISGAYTVGFEAGGWVGSGGQKWTIGVSCDDGAVNTCIRIGHTSAAGANLNSSPFEFHWTDGSSVDHAELLYGFNDGIEIQSAAGTAGTGSLKLATGNIYLADGQGLSINFNTMAASSGATAYLATGPAYTNVQLGNGNSTISLSAPIIFVGKTVAGLPTCNAGAKYQVVAVSDANAPTYNATLVGGGGTATLAMCNGTNWTAH